MFRFWAPIWGCTVKYYFTMEERVNARIPRLGAALALTILQSLSPSHSVWPLMFGSIRRDMVVNSMRLAAHVAEHKVAVLVLTF